MDPNTKGDEVSQLKRPSPNWYYPNPGVKFDPTWLQINPINEPEVQRRAKELGNKAKDLVTPGGSYRAAWLLKAVTLIDLTTLSGDDTDSNVSRLCHKALNPIRKDILKELSFETGNEGFKLTCGAICVYPARVSTAVKTLKRAHSSLPVASVATGFPAGQTTLKSCLQEIEEALLAGAREIDVVISRKNAITHDWGQLYHELKEMRHLCGTVAHMKTILAVGELSSLQEVYQASMVAMMAGSDFIKTSTGKEPVNATLPVGIVMGRAIKDYYEKTGYKVGLKPAGGIRVADDAINWLVLVKEIIGDEWLKPELFRIGASGLLGDIEKELYYAAYGRLPGPHVLPVQ